MSGLSLQGITIRYGRRTVIDGLSLPDLAAGQFTVLAGPNAAGKSTLLRAIAQLAPHHGRIAMAGRDLAHLPGPERARLVGFMPQTLPAGSSLIVLEGILAALRATGEMPATAAAATAMAVLERLGIGDLALRPMDQLSGGQRQMVSLAQTIVRNPKLLLLDEPISALDLARQVRLLAELRRLARDGRVVVAVLHDLALAARWADRIVVLRGGAVYSDGTPGEVLTPAMLAEVYGVEARVEHCSHGNPLVLIDRELPQP